ncbi:hypothetical protein ACFX13_043926 [Malus domestica]
MVKKRKGDREHMVYPATRWRGDHDGEVLETSSAAGTSAQAPSKSATKSAPLRLTASCALANGSSLPLSSASLLPPLALSSTGPGPSRKLMSRASQKNRLIRSLRTVKARTLLAEAQWGEVNAGRLLKKWHAH